MSDLIDDQTQTPRHELPTLVATPEARTPELEAWIKAAIQKYEDDYIILYNADRIHDYCRDSYDYAQLADRLANNSDKEDDGVALTTYRYFVLPTLYFAANKMLRTASKAHKIVQKIVQKNAFLRKVLGFARV